MSLSSNSTGGAAMPCRLVNGPSGTASVLPVAAIRDHSRTRENAKTFSPSVAGVADDGLFSLCRLSVCAGGMERRHSILPSAIQAEGQHGAGLVAGDEHAILVSPGDEFPKGRAVFHRTLCRGPNSTGRAAESATAEAFGPRKPDHSAAIPGMPSHQTNPVRKNYRHFQLLEQIHDGRVRLHPTAPPQAVGWTDSCGPSVASYAAYPCRRHFADELLPAAPDGVSSKA